MANQTEINSKIEKAFERLLQDTRFEKLTVTAIAKEAGISNQTFYRYYTDKIDLALQLSFKLLSSFALIYGDNSTWKEVSISILHSVKNHPVLFKRLIEDPDGLDMIIKSMFMISDHFTGKPSSAYAGSVWAVALKEWRKENFKTPVEEVYNNIRNNQPAVDVVCDEELCNKCLAEFENIRLRHFCSTDKNDD